MSSLPNKVLVSYVPSPHRGYLEFFRAYQGSVLYVMGKEFIQDFSSLTRNLPGDEPEEVQVMIQALNIFSDVRILTKENIHELETVAEIVMPDEEVSHTLAETYFKGKGIHFDNAWRLRWHWDSVTKKNLMEDSAQISQDDFVKSVMSRAQEVAQQSSDWWRQVGAVLVKEGEIKLVAFNKHFPSEQSPYLYGDPRSNFEAGKQIEVSSALHAEIGILSAAARAGISTDGTDLYVTTFPCPPCAYACANSGIKRLFYAEGYSLLEGGEVLKSRGVELFRVVL
jgi:dCMP deaminase